MDDGWMPEDPKILRREASKWEAQLRRNELQHRADEAKAARLDAQEQMLGLFPEAVSYLRMVLIGQVAPDADRLKVALKLADKILPNLQAVAVQGQVLGVDADDSNKQARLNNEFLNILAGISKECGEEEQQRMAERRRLEAQSPAVVQPEAAPDSSHGWKLPQGRRLVPE